MKLVLSGIDTWERGQVTLPDFRYGLVTSSAARTLEGKSSRALLHEKLTLTWLFSAEHGLDGTAKEGESVGNGLDPLTGLPVYSLYQHQVAGMTANTQQADATDTKENQQAATTTDTNTDTDTDTNTNPQSGALIPEHILADMDCFLYDLPDLGVRYYTYISTLLQIIDVCEASSKPLIILDRPCLLGGEVVEGVALAKADFSFVGAYSLPVRYGLTAGELATLYCREQGYRLVPQIIRVSGWSRAETIFETGRVFDIMSPNMPNRESALLYPGTCLIEGTNLSEGRGTARPFSWFGAPWLDAEMIVNELNQLAHPGLALRPTGFVPSASKYAGEACRGIALEVTKPGEVRAVAFMMEAIGLIKNRYPAEFSFPRFDGADVPFMQRLVGRELAAAEWPIQDFRELEARGTAAFRTRTKDLLIY